MDEPLDEVYLRWLYSKIGSVRLRNRSRTYWTLARQLYTKEFVWFVPNDDNRVEDGRSLRYEFIQEYEVTHVDPEWLGLGCSMLEMLIGLSRRLAFEADGGEPSRWFWKLIENLELLHFTDAYFEHEGPARCAAYVDEAMNRVIFRTYSYSGKGGLFPLNRAYHDQRDVEIWYQLNSYLLEN